MTFLNIAFPAASALPISQFTISSVLASLRPLLGLGMIATLMLIFKPLLIGVFRAISLLFSPAKTREQKSALRNLANILAIRRVANDLDRSSPNMAAELRALAARG